MKRTEDDDYEGEGECRGKQSARPRQAFAGTTITLSHALDHCTSHKLLSSHQHPNLIAPPHLAF